MQLCTNFMHFSLAFSGCRRNVGNRPEFADFEKQQNKTNNSKNNTKKTCHIAEKSLDERINFVYNDVVKITTRKRRINVCFYPKEPS